MTIEMDKLKDHLRDLVSRENCLLYDVEWVGQGGGRTLRVFIDKEGSEGVSIDDCSRVSRGLDLLLDVEDLVPGGSYHLEVSSPGLERQLKEPWHFERALGETILAQLTSPLGELCQDVPDGQKKRKKVSGVLRKVGETSIDIQLVEFADVVCTIKYESLQKARLVFSQEKNFGKKKVKRKEG